MMPQLESNLLQAKPLHVSSNFITFFSYFYFCNLFILWCSKSQEVVIRFPWFKYQNKEKLHTNSSREQKVYIFFLQNLQLTFLKVKKKTFWISKLFTKLKSKFKNVAPYNCWQVFSECLEPRMTKIKKKVFEILNVEIFPQKKFFAVTSKYQKFQKNGMSIIVLELHFTYNINISVKSVCK